MDTLKLNRQALIFKVFLFVHPGMQYGDALEVLVNGEEIEVTG